MITLLHPSRGRAEKAKKTYDFWKQNSSGKCSIQHILSIDIDDCQNGLYYELFKNNYESEIIETDNCNVVQATNNAAKFAEGDILIYLSDDFKCPKNWDLELLTKISIETNTTPLLLKVDDCLQKFEVPVLTIPIMNRELYQKLGYFWNPEYKSMFVDEDLYWTCKNNGWLIHDSNLKFPHEHPCNGKAENDETYKRSAENWDHGKALFARRKLLNFPL